MENNKTLIKNLIEEAWNKGNLDYVRQCVNAQAVNHDPANPDSSGADGFMELVKTYRTAFPDLHWTIDDQISEGDQVVTRWTAVGTNHGNLQGMPATHRKATVTGIEIDRCENGMIVESWVNWDTLGMMQQLGIIPAPSHAPA